MELEEPEELEELEEPEEPKELEEISNLRQNGKQQRKAIQLKCMTKHGGGALITMTEKACTFATSPKIMQPGRQQRKVAEPLSANKNDSSGGQLARNGSLG